MKNYDIVENDIFPTMFKLLDDLKTKTVHDELKKKEEALVKLVY